MNAIRFRITHDDSPEAIFQTMLNRAMLDNLLPSVTAQIGQGISLEDIALRMAQRQSVSLTSARALVKGLIVLSQLPRCLALARSHLHLDDSRVKVLGTTLGGLSSEKLSLVDEHLSATLTPSVAEEELILGRALGNRIQTILARIGEAREKPDMTPRASARVDDRGNYRFALTVSRTVGMQLYERLRLLMQRKSCDLAEAMLLLINGQQRPRAVLNLYQDPSGHVFADSGAPLTPSEIAGVEVTHTRVLRHDESCDGYRISKPLRALIKGRDGHCRFPGCSVSAAECDIDHVITYGNHGPTSAENLHLLCRHHHNMKTNGEVSVTMQPNGVDTWTLADGSVTRTLPTGAWAQLVQSTTTT